MTIEPSRPSDAASCMQDHLKLGEALAPLRDEGVMIVGSGLSYHNMRGFVFRGRGDPTSTKTASQVRRPGLCKKELLVAIPLQDG